MSTRLAWVDEGNDAADAILKANQITVPLFSAKDTKYATLAHFKTILARGYAGVGLYVCSQGEGWIPAATTAPEAWALGWYKRVMAIVPRGSGFPAPPVDLNCETDAEWVMRMLRQWRKNNPRRVTAYVPQCHKYPLFASYASELVSLNIIIRPECFTDKPKPMTRVESASELDGWQSIGIPRERIAPMLDAGQLGEWWSGTAYTQGRLQ